MTLSTKFSSFIYYICVYLLLIYNKIVYLFVFFIHMCLLLLRIIFPPAECKAMKIIINKFNNKKIYNNMNYIFETFCFLISFLYSFLSCDFFSLSFIYYFDVCCSSCDCACTFGWERLTKLKLFKKKLNEYLFLNIDTEIIYRIKKTIFYLIYSKLFLFVKMLNMLDQKKKRKKKEKK